MNANVSKLLNEQINKEFYSAYLYQFSKPSKPTEA